MAEPKPFKVVLTLDPNTLCFTDSPVASGVEYEISDATELVCCRDCKHRRTPTCFFYEVIKQEDRWMEEVHYRRIDHTQDDDFCSRGEKK